jgi:nitroimidazol reductase NimA-like FMN-containing flavoprotein (pyridoxamine 5'-phosphate oxidase superfamily)
VLQPSRRRPEFKEQYGIHDAPEGMLDWPWADERLAASRNYWIVTSDADGRPRSAPVWGVWFDDAVVFGSSPQSRKARNLARDPRVVINLESGDEVVILEGEGEPAQTTEEIAAAFAAKYDWKPAVGEREGWFQLRPRTAYAWLEADYTKSATRFDFYEA